MDGLVERPLTLDLDALRARPRVSATVTLECAGNGRALLEPRPVSQPWLTEAVGTAEWTGTPLAPLLREAGVADGAVDVVFTGADHGVERGVEQDYQRALPVAEALAEDVLLVYAMNGGPLPPQHGYPLRLVVPGWYGMTQVKWLSRIEVVAEHFDGFQMRAYRIRESPEDPGVPLTRIEPRALMVPPGFPDFMTRRRVARPGPLSVEGRAWSGWAPVVAVELSVDGGATWLPTTLEAAPGPYGWVRWSATWDAPPGRHELCVRARDESGRSQPVEGRWSRGGFANNAVQRVGIDVLDPAATRDRAPDR